MIDLLIAFGIGTVVGAFGVLLWASCAIKYPHVIQLQLPNGLTRSPTYWELERLKAGGGTDGQENTGAVHRRL